MKKRGQIWVETVIYTLIAFALIAAVLAFVKPKIQELQDKTVIEQSITLMKGIDSAIREIVQHGAGNKRELEITIKDGSLVFDARNNKIIFEMDTNYLYSEVGKEIPEGDLIILTTETSGGYHIKIEKDYSLENYNLKFEGEDTSKTITKGATSYTLFFSNKGEDANSGKLKIDIGF